MTFSRATRPPVHSAAQADRIFLRDHVVRVEIGAFQAERGQAQRLRFSVWGDLAGPGPGGLHDDVDGIVSYDVFVHAIDDELAAGRINLLETLAERIAARLLAQPGFARVGVTVEKLDRLEGALGIVIEREAGAVRAAVPPAAPADARLCLATQAAASRAAPKLLSDSTPTILCVAATPAPEREAPGLPAPVARRIALLALDQAAWRMAALDRRFVVVDSRTELDWGLRHGQFSVWAPSRMAADARGDVPARPCDADALAVWLARRIGIGRIDLLGAAPPRDVPEGLSVGPCDRA